jgi:hypothetical protein
MEDDLLTRFWTDLVGRLTGADDVSTDLAAAYGQPHRRARRREGRARGSAAVFLGDLVWRGPVNRIAHHWIQLKRAAVR